MLVLMGRTLDIEYGEEHQLQEHFFNANNNIEIFNKF